MSVPFEEVPELLRFLRKKNGQKLKQVGAAVGLPFQNISSHENGRSSPPLPTLGALLAHFGIQNYADLQLAQDEMRGVVSAGASEVSADKDRLADQARTIRGLQLLLSQLEDAKAKDKGPR